MARNFMIRSLLIAGVLGVSLVSGCSSMRDTMGMGDDSMDAGMSDSQIVAEIRQQMALNPELNSSQITVTERDGQVVLGGFATSLQDIDIVRGIAEQVSGVSGVEDNIVVQGM